MNTINELTFSQVIAIVAVFSSATSIIISKLYEMRQESLKHNRIIKEKILDSKLEAWKNAFKFYGTFLNYQYNSRSLLESLENYDYSVIMGQSNRNYEETLNNIQADAEFHHINLFCDFYGEEDEIIANKLKDKQKEYYNYTSDPESFNSEKEKELRTEMITSIDEAISYFKNKIKMVRNDFKME